jgi:hypothetical protein
MSQVVSRESLKALATMAFVSLLYTDDANAEPEYNMDDGAGSALFKLIREDREIEYSDRFFNGFTEGTEYGLAVAAAILTHGLDNNATVKAVREELANASKYWPKPEEDAA